MKVKFDFRALDRESHILNNLIRACGEVDRSGRVKKTLERLNFEVLPFGAEKGIQEPLVYRVSYRGYEVVGGVEPNADVFIYISLHPSREIKGLGFKSIPRGMDLFPPQADRITLADPTTDLYYNFDFKPSA